MDGGRLGCLGLLCTRRHRRRPTEQRVLEHHDRAAAERHRDRELWLRKHGRSRRVRCSRARSDGGDGPRDPHLHLRPPGGREVAGKRPQLQPGLRPPAKGVPGAGPLVAYAYCDKHEPSVEVRSRATTVDAGIAREPQCQVPARKRGGLRRIPVQGPATKGLTDYAYTSKRVGKQAWKIAVLNPDQMNPHKVQVFAYCEKHGPNLESRSAQEKTPPGEDLHDHGEVPQGSQGVLGRLQEHEHRGRHRAAGQPGLHLEAERRQELEGLGPPGPRRCRRTDANRDGDRLLRDVAAAYSPASTSSAARSPDCTAPSM